MKINRGGADRVGLCRRCSQPFPRWQLKGNKGYCQGCRPNPAVNQ